MFRKVCLWFKSKFLFECEKQFFGQQLYTLNDKKCFKLQADD